MNNFPSVRLHELSHRYASSDNAPTGEAFHHAFRRYLRHNRESLFDLALAATSADLESALLGDHTDPLLLKAIRDTNPGLSDMRLLALSDDEKMGVINSAKGKYFEYLVQDRLEHGEQVGAIA